MEPSSLAAAALRVVTGASPVPEEQRTSVQELVWARLGGSALGASALARFHQQPGEGAAGIVESVLADELRTDPAFAARLTAALRPDPASIPAPPAPPPPPAHKPAVPPPRPAAPPPPAASASRTPRTPHATATVASVPVLNPAGTRKVLLLGFPQAFACYTAFSVLVHADDSDWELLYSLLLLGSIAMAGYGLRLGTRLLRLGGRGGILVTAVLIDLVVLVGLVVHLVQWLTFLDRYN
ncbi:hypothetical protein [Streptomyces sp. NPDC021224]|uniref:hypothetical protein n=1 Tax=unclassified Streptomyces TaxID=2593676 RepID=UPI00378FC138